MEHFYQDIEGWFDFEALYSEAISRMPQNARMVEVGVYKGRSCFYLAVEAINSGKNIEIFAVDRFNWPSEVLRGFRKICSEKELKKVFACVGTSVEWARQVKDESIDFVFVDAGHDYEDVLADISHWWPKIKSGGILAGHDFCDEFPGVQLAVEEFFHCGSGKEATTIRIVPPSSKNPGIDSWWVEKK